MNQRFFPNRSPSTSPRQNLLLPFEAVTSSDTTSTTCTAPSVFPASEFSTIVGGDGPTILSAPQAFPGSNTDPFSQPQLPPSLPLRGSANATPQEDVATSYSGWPYFGGDAWDWNDTINRPESIRGEEELSSSQIPFWTGNARYHQRPVHGETSFIGDSPLHQHAASSLPLQLQDTANWTSSVLPPHRAAERLPSSNSVTASTSRASSTLPLHVHSTPLTAATSPAASPSTPALVPYDASSLPAAAPFRGPSSPTERNRVGRAAAPRSKRNNSSSSSSGTTATLKRRRSSSPLPEELRARASHNLVEAQYRSRLNAQFDALLQVVLQQDGSILNRPSQGRRSPAVWSEQQQQTTTTTSRGHEAVASADQNHGGKSRKGSRTTPELKTTAAKKPSRGEVLDLARRKIELLEMEGRKLLQEKEGLERRLQAFGG